MKETDYRPSLYTYIVRIRKEAYIVYHCHSLNLSELICFFIILIKPNLLTIIIIIIMKRKE
ncbi:hypothetical protein GE21DRAFT_1303976 [Neurospora crassa]|nr:hypothetical protein GE21DRAFT_1303976 [Neurospora crassa]